MLTRISWNKKKESFQMWCSATVDRKSLRRCRRMILVMESFGISSSSPLIMMSNTATNGVRLHWAYSSSSMQFPWQLSLSIGLPRLSWDWSLSLRVDTASLSWFNRVLSTCSSSHSLMLQSPSSWFTSSGYQVVKRMCSLVSRSMKASVQDGIMKWDQPSPTPSFFSASQHPSQILVTSGT